MLLKPSFREIITIFLLSVLGLVQAANYARADWINLTGAETSPNIAEITVLDDRVQVRLEVFVGDLETFKVLLPDSMLKDGGKNRPSLTKRLAHFSSEVFKVIGPDGVPFPVRLLLAEPRMRVDRKSPFAGLVNPQTRRRAPEPPEDKRVLYVELEYPFEGRPDKLTFSPPQNEDGNAKVSIGFIAYHKSVPVIDFRYLSADAELSLNWQDPWYSRFYNPNLKRHHKSAMMSFLYLEPRELRHEMLLRVRDLEQWIDLGIGADEIIDKQEQATIRQRARAYLETRNPLEADGIPLNPSSSRAEFLSISLSGLQVVEDDKQLDRSTAIIGVILSYTVEHLPQHVSVRWQLFNERITRIPASAIDPAGPFKTIIEVSEPVLEWKNFLLKYQEPEVKPVGIEDSHNSSVPVFSLALLIGALGSVAMVARQRGFPKILWGGISAMCILAAAASVRIGVVEVANPFPGTPDEAASTRIVTRILDNVNAAFLEKDPAALKQALAITVDNDALGDVEVELGRALAIKVAGGGVARVAAIENLQLREISALQGRRGFRSLAEWTAQASLGHWGHPHRRTIRFRALMELAEVAGTWKLIGITVIDAKQRG